MAVFFASARLGKNGVPLWEKLILESYGSSEHESVFSGCVEACFWNPLASDESLNSLSAVSRRLCRNLGFCFGHQSSIRTGPGRSLYSLPGKNDLCRLVPICAARSFDGDFRYGQGIRSQRGGSAAKFDASPGLCSGGVLGGNSRQGIYSGRWSQ